MHQSRSDTDQQPTQPGFVMNSNSCHFRLMCFLRVLAAGLSLTVGAESFGMDMVLKNVSTNGDATLEMSGPIVQGDAERLIQRILEVRRRTGNSVSVFRISSPGGEVVEAIRLGSVIRGMYGTVMVKENGMCASSCFLVWLNGAIRTARGSELPGPKASLAVHRPFRIASPDEKSSTEDLGQQQVKVMQVVRQYLEENLVPRALIDEMMSRPSNEAYVLRTEDLNKLGEIPPWFEEVAIAKCSYRRSIVDEMLSAKLVNDATRYKQLEAWDERVIECLSDVSSTPRYRFVQSLWKGERPWITR